MTMRLLGGYELLGRLATTDRTEVYLARRTSVGFEKIVVLKMVRNADLRDEARVIGRGARLLARFDHPHVAPVLDLGRCETGLYVVLEHVDGETLAGLVEGARNHAEPIAQAAVAYLGAAVARALHYCREQAADAGDLGWVRWQASLDNVLVGYDGTVKLIGFTASDDPPEPGRDSLRVAAVLWETVTGRRVTGGADSDLDWSMVARDLAEARESGPYQPSSIEELCASCAPRDGVEPPSLLDLARRLEGIAREAAPIFDESELRHLMARVFSSERARRRQLVDLALSARASVGGLVLDRIGPRDATKRVKPRLPVEPPAETRVLPTKLTLAVLSAIVLVALIAPGRRDETALVPRYRPPAVAPVHAPGPRATSAASAASPAAPGEPPPACVTLSPPPVIVVTAESAACAAGDQPQRHSPVAVGPPTRPRDPQPPAASPVPPRKPAPVTPPPLPAYTRPRGSGSLGP